MESLRGFLEEAWRDGESLPDEFLGRLHGAVESGELEILTASVEGRQVGIVIISIRPNVSTAADFASIEELYVRPQAQRRGVGLALLEAVKERCVDRSISYVEVQTDDEAAAFYEAGGYEEEPGVRVMSRAYVL